MKYFEISKPYYSVLRAEGIEECLNMYKSYYGKNYGRRESEYAELSIREVSKAEASELISKSYVQMVEHVIAVNRLGFTSEKID